MRKVTTPILFLAILVSFAGVSDARPARVGPGIRGSVTKLAKNYFMMDLAGGGYMKVFVTKNTRFELHGKESDGTHVKEGSHVRVAGTTVDGSTLEALLVNVTSE